MSATEEVIKSCFQDIVSIRGLCNDIASTSGLYSNDIDITKEFIDEIVTRQYKGSGDFFTQKKNFAIKQVADEIITYLTPKFRAGTLLSNYRIGHFQDNLKLIAGDGNLKGINIDLCNSDSYLNLFISEISLQLNYTGDVNVLVYDLIQNKLLDTITVSCVANEISTVYPSKVYKSNRQKSNLVFVYDSTGKDSNTTYLNSAGCVSCSGKSVNNPYAKISAVKIDSNASKIKANLKIIGETGGLSIVHSYQCNHEQWLCSYSNMLAMSVLYKLGEEIVQFALNVSPNDRVNTTVTINPEELDRRRLIFQAEYSKSFQNLIDNIQLPSDSRCFHCKEGVKHSIALQ